MADYIKKEDFNEEMLKCIAQGSLTNKSIDMFRLIAKELSKTFNFKYTEERYDAIDNAVFDFASNWRGYKYKPVFKMKVSRNFRENETISIEVKGMKKITLTARAKPKTSEHFKIDVTENKTLENLAESIEKLAVGKLSCSLHKVTKKITIVDDINEIGEYGTVVIDCKTNPALYKSKNKVGNFINENFEKPPHAFNWATSVARNGIIKSIDKLRPKDTRNGKVITFSEITSEKGELFGI